MAGGGASSSYTIETRVGRLIEARVFGLRTRDEADDYSRALGLHVLRMPKETSPVLCADHRPVQIYPQAAADRLVELFTRMNARLERVAIVVARTNATLVLQLERMVREAAFPSRKVFFVADDAAGHLSLALTPKELERARGFLDEYPVRSGRSERAPPARGGRRRRDPRVDGRSREGSGAPPRSQVQSTRGGPVASTRPASGSMWAGRQPLRIAEGSDE